MVTGVKEFDAIHVACAIAGHCEYFISVDKRLLKYKSEQIIVCNPIEFINNFEI
jgi:predicted nucleic acid-binding protein